MGVLCNRGGKLLFLLAVILIWLSNGCSITRDQLQGSVYPTSFRYQLPFSTLKNIIVLPVQIEGQTRNFLFDTGAQLSVIQRDSMIGDATSFTGASNRTMEMGREIVPSLSIGPIQFRDTHAGNGDLVGLKEHIPDFGGLIGQPIIRKANWLIDYPKKQITLSSNTFSKEGFQRIYIDRKSGSPFIQVNVFGQLYEAIVDMGSSSTFSIPLDHPLADIVQSNYKFSENSREVYTLGGVQKITELTGNINEILIDNLSFDKVYTDIRNTSKLRVGMRFFKDCMVLMDQASGDYWIKQNTPPPALSEVPAFITSEDWVRAF